MKNMVRILLVILAPLTLALLGPIALAKQSIFVSASPEGGRYDGPTYVTLTASNPDAQIWYTCRRNGTPADLVQYEKPILLSKSCALNYFAYVDYENESKIERTDYTILYSDSIRLETSKSGMLSLKNTGKETVDIGGWAVIAGTGGLDIPAGTTIAPQGAYIVGKVDPATYELKSPEGYVKSKLFIDAIFQNQKPLSPARIASKEASQKSGTKQKAEAKSGSTQIASSSTEEGTPPTQHTPSQEVPQNSPSPIEKEPLSIKASVSENSTSSKTAGIIGVVLLILAGIATRMRKNSV